MGIIKQVDARIFGSGQDIDGAADLFVVDEGGTTKKVTMGQISTDYWLHGSATATTQAIGTGSWAAVTWNTEVIASGMMDFGTNPTYLVNVPSGTEVGTYIVGATVEFTANGTGYRAARLMENGSTERGGEVWIEPESTNNDSFVVTAMVVLTNAEYVTLEVYQDSGGNLNLIQAFGWFARAYS